MCIRYIPTHESICDGNSNYNKKTPNQTKPQPFLHREKSVKEQVGILTGFTSHLIGTSITRAQNRTDVSAAASTRGWYWPERDIVIYEDGERWGWVSRRCLSSTQCPKICLSITGNYTNIWITALYTSSFCTEVFHGEEVIVRLYNFMLQFYLKTCPRASSWPCAGKYLKYTWLLFSPVKPLTETLQGYMQQPFHILPGKGKIVCDCSLTKHYRKEDEKKWKVSVECS